MGFFVHLVDHFQLPGVTANYTIIAIMRSYVAAVELCSAPRVVPALALQRTTPPQPPPLAEREAERV
eukprot:5447786-Pleurochrysis_carterae.AAC.3